jgi:hypothetical protein
MDTGDLRTGPPVLICETAIPGIERRFVRQSPVVTYPLSEGVMGRSVDTHARHTCDPAAAHLPENRDGIGLKRCVDAAIAGAAQACPEAGIPVQITLLGIEGMTRQSVYRTTSKVEFRSVDPHRPYAVNDLSGNLLDAPHHAHERARGHRFARQVRHHPGPVG